MAPGPETDQLRARVTEYQETFARLESETGRVIVGYRDVVRSLLAAFFAGGHVLLEGVPGLGKTLMAKSVSHALGLSFQRIQSTPDLMPSDIIGTEILIDDPAGRRFHFRPGPLFAHIVLADEINRATPKTQSAVLEAMEEQQVTLFGETRALPRPFFVLATQNPIELEGTYPLPEAQLDRFLAKLVMEPPRAPELNQILDRTTSGEPPRVSRVLDPEEAPRRLEGQRQLVREALIGPPLQDYVVRLIDAANPTNGAAPTEVRRYLRLGPSPRAAQAVVLMAKALALAEGRMNVAYAEIDAVLAPALRHRCLLNFHAEADGVRAEDIVARIRTAVPREV